MKTTLATALQALVSVAAIAQAPINVQLTGSPRAIPLIGLNANAHNPVATWNLPDFLDSTVQINPGLLRYPGGTTANHWDWQTGWFQNSPCTPTSFSNITPVGQDRAEEYKVVVDATGAETVFVINYQCSDINYQLQGLHHAESVGIPVTMVEIGNEHNLQISSQFIAPGVYGPAMAQWADSIKAHFPGVKICLVGGEPPAQQGWHDSIYAYNPDVDALSFHVYLGAGNTDVLFNTKRALSVPFAQLLARFNQSNYNQSPTNTEVWVTEYNLGEALWGTTPVHLRTWTHALYVSAMSHILMKIPQITMLVNYNISNSNEFAAIDPFTHKITANGVASMLLHNAAEGMTTAEELSFPSQAQVSWQSTTYPSLIGWKFSNANGFNVWLCNLSSSPIQLSMAQLMGGTFDHNIYSADSALFVDGISSLASFVGNATDLITIPPFSIGIHTPNSISVDDWTDPVVNLNLWPNPANGIFSLNSRQPVALNIYRVDGRLMHRSEAQANHRIDCTAWDQGVYFVNYQGTFGSGTKRLMVIH